MVLLPTLLFILITPMGQQQWNEALIADDLKDAKATKLQE